MPTKEPGAIDSLVYDLHMDIPLPWLPQTSAAEEWLQTQTLLTKTTRGLDPKHSPPEKPRATSKTKSSR